MEKDSIESYTMDQMRLLRHDFMNYLQVVFGYIQLNKPDKAVNYIKNLNNYMITISKVYNLESDILGLLFQDFILKCSKLDVDIKLDIEISEADNTAVRNKYEYIRNLLDSYLERLSSYDNKILGINILIKSFSEGFNIIISNSTIINSVQYHDFLYKLYTDGDMASKENYIFFEEGDILALIINLKYS